MNRKSTGGIIFLVLIIGTFITYQCIRYSSIEKYIVSNDGTVITSGKGQQYVSGGVDFMSLKAVFPGKQIGKTDDSGAVYEIKGQPGLDWVAFDITDEMSITELYHKKQIKPFSLLDKKIKSIRLVGNKGFKQAIGLDIVSSKEQPMLKELNNTINQTYKPQNVKFNNIVSLQLLLDEYKGIAYVIFANITPDNKVFVSKVNGDNSVRAGALLSKWVLKNAPK